MTVTSGEINFQSMHDLICHLAKVKATTPANSMAGHDTFFSVFNILFEYNTAIKQKENIFYIHVQ